MPTNDDGHVMTPAEIEASEREFEASIRNNPNWITDGWSRHPNSRRWVELGGTTGITIDPPPLPPELGIHDVAAKLNELESQCWTLAAKCNEAFDAVIKLTKRLQQLTGQN